jgi:small nuclear ribonucleoprotein (snRNP)-like protein
MWTPFNLTIIFIALSTLVAAFIRRRSRNKCLMDFSQNIVTLEDKSGKTVSGRLRVENTGLELVYPAARRNEAEQATTSYILYKYEYPNIQVIVRYHDQLSEANKKQRQLELKRTYHPGPLRRLKRKTLNIFKTIRDSVAEVINLFISRAKKTAGIGETLTSQDKYLSQMKQELMGSVGTSYEPLLERYIGHRVMLELIKGEKIVRYSGVLKEYTAEFIEIMDVNYAADNNATPTAADLVVLRKYGLVRNLAE